MGRGRESYADRRLKEEYQVIGVSILTAPIWGIAGGLFGIWVGAIAWFASLLVVGALLGLGKRPGRDLIIRSDREAANFAGGRYWLLLRPFKWDTAFVCPTGDEIHHGTYVEREHIALGAVIARSAERWGCELKIIGGAATESEARAKVPGDWQQAVLHLMDRAERIIIVPSTQPGTLWELEQLFARSYLDKTWVLVPPLYWTVWAKNRVRRDVVAALGKLGVTMSRSDALAEEGGLFLLDRSDGVRIRRLPDILLDHSLGELGSSTLVLSSPLLFGSTSLVAGEMAGLLLSQECAAHSSLLRGRELQVLEYLNRARKVGITIKRSDLRRMLAHDGKHLDALLSSLGDRGWLTTEQDVPSITVEGQAELDRYYAVMQPITLTY